MKYIDKTSITQSAVRALMGIAMRLVLNVIIMILFCGRCKNRVLSLILPGNRRHISLMPRSATVLIFITSRMVERFMSMLKAWKQTSLSSSVSYGDITALPYCELLGGQGKTEGL